MKSYTWRVIKNNHFMGYINAKTKYEAIIKSMMEYGIIGKIEKIKHKIIIGGFK
jgi:hypothetical protein